MVCLVLSVAVIPAGAAETKLTSVYASYAAEGHTNAPVADDVFEAKSDSITVSILTTTDMHGRAYDWNSYTNSALSNNFLQAAKLVAERRAAVDDSMELLRRTQRDYPGVPYFVLGHSMGSFLTRTLLFRYPDAGLRAAVICGTGWQPAPVLAAGLALCGLEKLRLGETGRSKLLANLMFGAYNRKFPDARTPNDWICSDPEVVVKYTADPLCGQDATIGLTREMLRGIRMIQRPANLQHMDKALPVFLIAGRSDPVGNMGRGVEKAAAAFRAAGMQDVACKLYDGRHEILNEKNRQLVYDDVLAFYERHLD